MKFFLVFVALFAVTWAAIGEREIEKIAQQIFDVDVDGYHFLAETSIGTYKSKKSGLGNVATNKTIVVSGSISFIDKETGEKSTVTYIADKNGFLPGGIFPPILRP